MNVELLLREFARLADSPEAIVKLRQFATRLAVTGRLSDQLTSERPPDAVRSLPDMIPGQAAGLPSNWLTAPLRRLIDLRYGRGLAASERMEQGRVAVYGSNGVVSRTRSALTNVPAIIVGRKGSAGALVIADGPSWTTDVAYYIVPPPYFDMRFLFLALQDLDLAGLSKGVKPGLSLSDVHPLPLPVPPPAEQHRIVAKVDELMTLCDQLEEAQKEREARRDGLRAASLNRLTASDGDAKPGSADVRFFLDTSPRLIAKPEHVAALRETILDLAVQGRLVLRDPRNPWRHTTLGALGKWGSGGTPDRGRADFYGGDIPWIVIGDLNESIVTETASTLTELGLQSSSAKMVEAGAVLIAMYGASVGKLGVAGVPCATNQAIAHCIPDSSIVERNYLWLYLRGLRKALIASGRGGAQPNISQSILKAWLVLLPALAEQRRIVVKVDQLMALCDKLEAALAAAQDGRARLLEALLHEALEGGAVRISVQMGTAV